MATLALSAAECDLVALSLYSVARRTEQPETAAELRRLADYILARGEADRKGPDPRAFVDPKDLPECRAHHQILPCPDCAEA
jgi:hypothetical protein